jgi:hypothetical protein
MAAFGTVVPFMVSSQKVTGRFGLKSWRVRESVTNEILELYEQQDGPY